MTRPTVAQAEAWRPDSLCRIADDWDAAATGLDARVDDIVTRIHGSRDFWTGSAADAAHRGAQTISAGGALATRCLIAAAVAARDGAEQIGSAKDEVLDLVAAARAEGFIVADDGAVTGGAPSPLVSLSGGPAATRDVLSTRIAAALDRMGAADADAVKDIVEALNPPHAPPAHTAPAGGGPVPLADAVAGWSAIGRDRIANQIAAMTPQERQRLIDEFPKQVGNTDGVPWPMRIAANRVNIAQAIADERGSGQPRRCDPHRLLSGSARRGRRPRPQRAPRRPPDSRVRPRSGVADRAQRQPGDRQERGRHGPGDEHHDRGFGGEHQDGAGDLCPPRGARSPRSPIWVGRFPRGDNMAAALADAADPRYALEMAPRLVTFSEDVDRTVDATGRDIPVTYVGHSYGGTIVGTAEELGLTADRTLYLAAAGAGVGVDDPSDWHNRNPDVLRFSMTAPGDLIQAVQDAPILPHGADPDEMPGVIHLPAGDYDDGRPMAGPDAHGDVINAPSDSWRNILAVITGDSSTLHKAG